MNDEKNTTDPLEILSDYVTEAHNEFSVILVN